MTKLINKEAERLNPCLKEQELSYQCLNKNGYDHSKCEEYFDNYNTCKKFWYGLRDVEERPSLTWQPDETYCFIKLYEFTNTPIIACLSKNGKVYKDRKAKGQYPYLPEVEDREKIKAQYFSAVRNN